MNQQQLKSELKNPSLAPKEREYDQEKPHTLQTNPQKHANQDTSSHMASRSQLK